jgi:hypothetical protein
VELDDEKIEHKFTNVGILLKKMAKPIPEFETVDCILIGKSIVDVMFQVWRFCSSPCQRSA